MAYVPLEHPFIERLRSRVLFAAGPIGSTILSLRPVPDYGGIDGCNEYLTVSDPDVLARIQRSFYAAGCDAVDSATFGSNEVVFAEYGLTERVRELNRLAARQLNAVRDEFSTPDWPRYSFGTMGPGTKLPSLGHITWDELVHSYREQAFGLIEGGIDVLKGRDLPGPAADQGGAGRDQRCLCRDRDAHSGDRQRHHRDDRHDAVWGPTSPAR